MKLDSQTISALISTIVARGDKWEEKRRAQIAAITRYEEAAIDAYNAIKKIDKSVRRALNIPEIGWKEINKRTQDYKHWRHRRRNQSLRNAVIVAAIMSKDEKELLKRVSKISPFAD